jgi:hypothetical protein
MNKNSSLAAASGVAKFKTNHCGEFGHTVMFKYDLNIQKISCRDK